MNSKQQPVFSYTVHEEPTQRKPMNDKEFLLELKEYIEGMEHEFEMNHGSCRTKNALIASGEMPDVYDETIRRIDAA